jgi:antitoxin VapB
MITMPMSIRSPRVEQLTRSLAKKRKTTMTNVLLQALENETRREKEAPKLPRHIQEIVDDLWRMSKPGGHMMTKEEIDAMWGHE